MGQLCPALGLPMGLISVLPSRRGLGDSVCHGDPFTLPVGIGPHSFEKVAGVSLYLANRSAAHTGVRGELKRR